MAREALKTREGLPDIHQLTNQGFFVYSIPVVSRDESTGQTRNFGTVTIAVRQECSSYEELGRYLQENSGNRGNARVLNYNANWEYASAGVRDIGAAVANAVEEEGTRRLVAVVAPLSSVLQGAGSESFRTASAIAEAGAEEAARGRKPPFQAFAEEERAGAGAAAPATEAERARTAPVTGEAESAARSQRRGLSSNWTRVPNVEWAGMGQMYVRLDRLDQAARTEFERLNMVREPDYQTWVRDHIDQFPLAFTTPRLGDRSTRE